MTGESLAGALVEMAWSNQLQAMPHHRFKLGQTVAARAPNVRPGPCTVVRLLPVEGKEPSYRVKDENGVERAFLESQLTAVPVNSGDADRVFSKTPQDGR